MRRPLIAFSLVFVLLAGLFGYTVAASLDARDAVSFTAQQQVGDPGAAQGVQLNLSTALGWDMVWDTALTLGEPLSCHTDFRYDPGNVSWYSDQTAAPTLVVPGGNTHLYFWESDLSSDPAALAYQPVIQDVISRAPDGGGTYSETLNLKRYLEYYPVFLSDLPLPAPYDYAYQSWDLSQALRIPVGASDIVTVDVEKNSDNTIASVFLSVPQSPSLMNEAILCNNRYYILFAPQDMEGNLIPGASPAGLYSVPASSGATLAGENVTLCCRSQGLPSSLTVVDGGTHLLFVEELEQGQAKAILLDAQTYQTAQEIPLQLPDTPYYLLVRDHYLALITTSEQNYPAPLSRVTVWAKSQFGLFEQVIDCDVTSAHLELRNSPTAYFDQNRLVLAYYQGSSDTGYIPNPSVYVLVCTPEGLAYAAHLVHNQSAAGMMPYSDLILGPTP